MPAFSIIFEARPDAGWKLVYTIHLTPSSKDVSLQRAAGIAPTVKEWFSDPLHPGRQVGWATCPSDGCCTSVESRDE
jgi:hypothetical protein